MNKPFRYTKLMTFENKVPITGHEPGFWIDWAFDHKYINLGSGGFWLNSFCSFYQVYDVVTDPEIFSTELCRYKGEYAGRIKIDHNPEIIPLGDDWELDYFGSYGANDLRRTCITLESDRLYDFSIFPIHFKSVNFRVHPGLFLQHSYVVQGTVKWNFSIIVSIGYNDPLIKEYE